MELYKEGEEKFGFCTSKLYEAIPKYFLRDLYQAVISDVEKYSPAKILDVGCGTANVDKIIAEKFPEASIYAIDPSMYMTKITERKLARYGSRIHVSQGSSRYIPFDIKFDMVFSSLSFHHWKCREKGLETMSQYVDKNGFIAIYEYNAGARGLVRIRHRPSKSGIVGPNPTGPASNMVYHSILYINKGEIRRLVFVNFIELRYL